MEYKEIKLIIILVSVVALLTSGFELNITKKCYCNEKKKFNITEITTYSFSVQNMKKKQVIEMKK